MKKLITLLLLSFLITSCSDSTESDDDSPVAASDLIACFTLDKESAQVGEQITISNCSEGATSYEFDFGNGSTSTQTSPTISFEESGEYTIQLKVVAGGNSETSNVSVIIRDIKDNYVASPRLNGDFIFPIDFGLTPNQDFYYIENYRSQINTNPFSYKYIEIDNSNTFSENVIAPRFYNSSHASMRILNDNSRIFSVVYSLEDQIGLRTLITDANGSLIDSFTNSYRTLYGSMNVDNTLLFYGQYRNVVSSEDDYSLYKSPAIEIRNADNELIERISYYETIEQGFIGDLIKTDNGYYAFGGASTPLSFSTFESYQPLLLILNSDFELINTIVFENTVLSNTVNNFDKLNGSFHVEQLSNGNLVLYSHNELRIVNNQGEELKRIVFGDHSFDNQALLPIENEGFIISEKEYIRKYDLNGELVKSIKFEGNYTPRFVEKSAIIYFLTGIQFREEVTGVGELDVSQNFLGAIDYDLNVINLN